MSNLGSQAIKSVKWTTISTALIALIGPLLLLIKARFLSPSDFAALAIVTIFIGLFTTFENFGISQAIIQRDKLVIEEISSLFFFNVIITFSIGIILFIASSQIAQIFAIPELKYLLKVTSAIVVINGPFLLFRAFMEKHLYFKELSIINIVRHLILLVSTVILLYFGLGVFGVVLGQVISTAVSSLLVLTFNLKMKVCKISFYFSMSRITSFLKFGVFVSGKQASTYLTHRVDEIIIGYFFSSDILGTYHFAKNMLDQLRRLITSSFAKVLFPVLSKIKHNYQKLTEAYMTISKYVGFFSFPVFIGIAITAHLFVPLFFGEEWVNSVPYFQVISLTLLFLVLTANISTSLLYSIGKPNVVMYIDIITNSIYLLSLIILASQGVYTVLILYCSYVVYKTISLQYYTSKYLQYGLFKYIVKFKKIIVISLAMVVVVLLIQELVNDLTANLGLFIISVITGVIVYLGGSLLLDRKTLYEITSALFKKRLNVSKDVRKNEVGP